MKYLVDANVWLDVVLDRGSGANALKFLQTVVRGSLATTDFAVNAVGLYLYRKNADVFRRFLDDLVTLRINTLHLAPTSLRRVLDVIQNFRIDFDDALQYVGAERDDLKMVSSDADFDRTPRGRLTPAQALVEIQSQQQP